MYIQAQDNGLVLPAIIISISADLGSSSSLKNKFTSPIMASIDIIEAQM